MVRGTVWSVNEDGAVEFCYAIHAKVVCLLFFSFLFLVGLFLGRETANGSVVVDGRAGRRALYTVVYGVLIPSNDIANTFLTHSSSIPCDWLAHKVGVL
jgi:hypothetical protein